MALLTTAALTALPAIVDLIDHLQSPRSPGLAAWSVLSLAIATLELSFIPYLAQWAHRAAFRFVAVTLLLLAMAFALLLGIAVLSGIDGRIVGWLGLAQSLVVTRLWSALLIATTTVAALITGRH